LSYWWNGMDWNGTKKKTVETVSRLAFLYHPAEAGC